MEDKQRGRERNRRKELTDEKGNEVMEPQTLGRRNSKQLSTSPSSGTGISKISGCNISVTPATPISELTSAKSAPHIALGCLNGLQSFGSKSFGSFGNLRECLVDEFKNTRYEEEWDELEEKEKALEKLSREYRDDAVCMTNKEKSIRAELKEFKSLLKVFETRVNQDRLSGDFNEKQLDISFSSITQHLSDKKHTITVVSSTLPQKNSFLLSMITGDINVTLPRVCDRVQYKRDYELFKLIATFLGCLFTLLRLYLDYQTTYHLPILDVLFHVYLAWYYLTVILREQILIANGSHIRQWWLWHHYLSLAIVIIILIWPDSPDSMKYRAFYPRFNVFACFMGVVQMVEFDYQRRRMYKLRALGKTDVMDLASDGLQE
eukprot:Ihof_evm13s37 gene=Ihof_evmTU13s37